jgi:hypothetical protein
MSDAGRHSFNLAPIFHGWKEGVDFLGNQLLVGGNASHYIYYLQLTLLYAVDHQPELASFEPFIISKRVLSRTQIFCCIL